MNTIPTIEQLTEDLNSMCERCMNHSVCEGTGCRPKKDLEALIERYTPTRGARGTYPRDDCPSCGHNIFPHMKYCNLCGQAINWEASK